MADRFYVNCALAPGSVILDGAEAHHLATVCRIRPGQQVYLFNGDGRQYLALVTTIDRRSVALNVEQVEAPDCELPFRVAVAAPLPKGDRAQFLVEKLTELGVSSFTPLQTRRSVVHPREARWEKLQRYVIEASKQCGRNTLMQIEPLADWESYCTRADLPRLRVLAHPGEREQRWPAGQDVALAVGPEGGFTVEEVECARQNGWTLVGLGPRILRVETAAIVLAAWASNSSSAAPATLP